MTTDAAEVVATGSLPLAILLAVLAGVVSFASPCVLPLVPGFLGYVTGLTDEKRRTRLVSGALLFVLGFSVVFVGIAAAFDWATSLTQEHRGAMLRVGGVVVILLAMVYLGFIGQRGVGIRWRPAAGLAGAPLLGVAFGIGMSPCIGPVYGSILALASPLSDSSDTVPRGVALAACYSLGMGIPFVLIAAGWSRAEKASRWLRNHHRPIQLIGGCLMLAVGVLMVSGVWEHFISWIQTSLVGVDGFKPAI
ncbi:cytochrome c biogenesis CcdA family protein [Luteipulveratus mongoliensis]|uniref:Cytochrome C biogenesis protein ResC n=1 Tax=Luteipulveratus mongoliensis TaxID=571913 RepID=A0A0K1JMP7_9MICO|nr:cytochrome c biogenesis CcdA family protein [Luteipulveratus mongoliensis]AKU17986.1 cytochrome C biogenesis protein ResC [Luteipulveratus mongoliensis]